MIAWGFMVCLLAAVLRPPQVSAVFPWVMWFVLLLALIVAAQVAAYLEWP